MGSHKHTSEALHWIVKILRKHRVPFHITGGFAARVYGSERVLRDIDIELPTSGMKKVLKDIAPYLIYGPKQYKDRHFQVPLITLQYQNQKIDLSASDDLKLYDARTRKWVKYPVHVSRSPVKRVFGMHIRIASPEHLLRYKSMMMEKVQVEDIKAIEEHLR